MFINLNDEQDIKEGKGWHQKEFCSPHKMSMFLYNNCNV